MRWASVSPAARAQEGPHVVGLQGDVSRPPLPHARGELELDGRHRGHQRRPAPVVDLEMLGDGDVQQVGDRGDDAAGTALLVDVRHRGRLVRPGGTGARPRVHGQVRPRHGGRWHQDHGATVVARLDGEHRHADELAVVAALHDRHGRGRDDVGLVAGVVGAGGGRDVAPGGAVTHQVDADDRQRRPTPDERGHRGQHQPAAASHAVGETIPTRRSGQRHRGLQRGRRRRDRRRRCRAHGPRCGSGCGRPRPAPRQRPGATAGRPP